VVVDVLDLVDWDLLAATVEGDGIAKVVDGHGGCEVDVI
jgi:hypothetical protein